MVSPELLRRYGFFAGLNGNQLKQIAMISEEVSYEKGETIFEECEQANALFILQSGNIDLFYRVVEENQPQNRKEYFVGEINPGEVFGVSALLEPYAMNATARAALKCSTVKIDADALRKLIQVDADLGFNLMMQTSKALMERLGATRVQLAAAWAK
jgi:CRP-like cAMP-binding protein